MQRVPRLTYWLSTPGGVTDVTEKIASLLRSVAPDLRVVVPRYAKSNGTMLALVGSAILMGPCSELGPSDPLIPIGPNNFVPAHFLATTQNIDPIIQQAAAHAIRQTAQLATALLSTGMMQGKDPTQIDNVVKSLSTRHHYPSHGSVIDMAEAERLGLNVLKFTDADELWQRLWLLRCMFEHDAIRAGAVKIFEGPYMSNSLRRRAHRTGRYRHDKRPRTGKAAPTLSGPLHHAKAVPSHVRPPIIQFRDKR